MINIDSLVPSEFYINFKLINLIFFRTNCIEFSNKSAAFLVKIIEILKSKEKTDAFIVKFAFSYLLKCCEL